MAVDRRFVLEAGTALATTGLAGCLGTAAFGGADRTTYEDWLALHEHGVAFAAVDRTVLDRFGDRTDEAADDESAESEGDTGDGTDRVDASDPMLAVPLGTAVVLTYGADRALDGTGLDGLLGVRDESTGDLERTVEGVARTVLHRYPT